MLQAPNRRSFLQNALVLTAEREREKLEKEGFKGVLEQVTELEKRLGIHDLAQFTPAVTG